MYDMHICSPHYIGDLGGFLKKDVKTDPNEEVICYGPLVWSCKDHLPSSSLIAGLSRKAIKDGQLSLADCLRPRLEAEEFPRPG